MNAQIWKRAAAVFAAAGMALGLAACSPEVPQTPEATSTSQAHPGGSETRQDEPGEVTEPKDDTDGEASDNDNVGVEVWISDAVKAAYPEQVESLAADTASIYSTLYGGQLIDLGRARTGDELLYWSPVKEISTEAHWSRLVESLNSDGAYADAVLPHAERDGVLGEFDGVVYHAPSSEGVLPIMGKPVTGISFDIFGDDRRVESHQKWEMTANTTEGAQIRYTANVWLYLVPGPSGWVVDEVKVQHDGEIEVIG